MSLLRTLPRPVPPPSDPLQHTAPSLWNYMRPIRAKWFFGMFIAILASVTAISIPQVLAWVVDHLVGSQNPTGQAVWLGGLIIIGMGLLQAGLLFIRRMLVVDTATQVENGIRMKFFDHLARATVSFHDRWPSGQLLTRSTSDLSLIRRWTAYGSIQCVASVSMLVLGLVFLFRGSMVLGMIYLCSVPMMFWALWFFVQKYKALTREVQQQSGDLATGVEESVQGVRVLKALGQGQNALGRFTVQAAELKDTEISRARSIASVLFKTNTIAGLTMALSLFIGIQQVANQHMSIGELTAYFATTAILTPQIERFGMLLGLWLDSKVAMERHREIMSEPIGEDIILINGISAPHISRHDAASLEFENATFSYQDARSPIIENLSLKVAPGEILALVGSTGSGKSTLLQLIPRLYSVTGGKVLLDGEDIEKIPLPELRSHMTIAFEEPVLFSSSVRDNVLLGVEKEGKTEEELNSVVETALRVSSSDFVKDLPEGVHALVGEEGMSLSGGQRQRLSLARAIAGNPRVLLLDDPLSALDVNTEEAVVGMLKEQLTNTTTIITAHRPSTVSLADRVALMENGRITAVGNHSELMRIPAYAELMLLLPEEKTDSTGGKARS